jgi:hypothetical protein
VRPVAAPKEEQFDLASVGLDKPVFDLQSTANVGDRMARYYKDFNDAQRFAKTMWKQYKIDVTAPDPSNPVAIRAAESFGKMLANLQYTQNLAKNAEAQLRNSQQAYAAGNVDMQPQAFGQGQFFSEFAPQAQMVSTKVPEFLEKAGSETSRTVDNTRDFNRLMGDWQKLKDEAQAQYKANPTQDNYRRLQYVEYQRPTFNTEATRDSRGGGRTFIDTALEELALLTEGSSKYYTKTNEYDAGGGRILRSDKFKGRVIGSKEPTGKQVRFIVDHIEYRPGEGGMFFVDAGDNVIPVKPNDIVEMYTNISDIPKSQFYKHIAERYDTDVLTARDLISPENIPSLANQEELMADSPQILAKRGQTATQMAEGLPNPLNLGDFGTINLPWNKNIVAKNPSTNQEITVKRKGGDLVSVTASDWKKITGNSDGAVTVDNQVIDKNTAINGIPKELMLRVLERRKFEVPGMGQQRPEVYEPKSQAEYEAIPKGAKWRDPKTGQVKIKP